jgi:hypothetical protein
MLPDLSFNEIGHEVHPRPRKSICPANLSTTNIREIEIRWPEMSVVAYVFTPNAYDFRHSRFLA